MNWDVLCDTKRSAIVKQDNPSLLPSLIEPSATQSNLIPSNTAETDKPKMKHVVIRIKNKDKEWQPIKFWAEEAKPVESILCTKS